MAQLEVSLHSNSTRFWMILDMKKMILEIGQDLIGVMNSKLQLKLQFSILSFLIEQIRSQELFHAN